MTDESREAEIRHIIWEIEQPLEAGRLAETAAHYWSQIKTHLLDVIDLRTRLAEAEQERDAALAEVKALREALECIAHPVEKLDYGDPENLPAVMTLHALGALAALDAKEKP